MTIRAQRIAGLTALLIGIGVLIGGVFLYLFVGLAVATNVVGYWISDRLALRVAECVSRLRALDGGQHVAAGRLERAA